MRKGHAFVVAVGVLVSLQAELLPQDRPTPKSAAQAPTVYATPNAVFDAYREAIAKNDTRTVLLCQVPEMRGDAYQAFVSSGMAADKPKVVAVLKKFGTEAIWPQYVKQYKSKHGVDPEKAEVEYDAKLEKALSDYYARHGKNAPYPEAIVKQLGAEPRDEQLLRSIANQKIPDSIAFIAELEDAARNADSEPNLLGPLKNLRIKGDTAEAETTQAIYGISSEGAGKPNKRFRQDVPMPINFRKTKAGWLICYANPSPAGVPSAPHHRSPSTAARGPAQSIAHPFNPNTSSIVYRPGPLPARYFAACTAPRA